MSARYCVLSDSRYLPRALVMYESLRAHSAEPFDLDFYSFDGKTSTILRQLALPGVRVFPIEEIETPEMRRARAGRSPLEYIWTCKPLALEHSLLHSPRADGVAYVEADLLFCGDPAILFNELGDGSLLLTPHYCSPRSWVPEVPRSGKYCAQFLWCRNDAQGREALSLWGAWCLEWCYDRYDEGRCGDQKYLERLPILFGGVREVRSRASALGPWNTPTGLFRDGGGRLFLQGAPVAFYHFHHFRPLGGGYYQLTHGYPVSRDAVDLIYRPYIAAYEGALRRLRRIEPALLQGQEFSAKYFSLGGIGESLLKLIGRVPILRVPSDAK